MTGNDRKMKRVLLIGPAPINVGGISMHLGRLMAMMEKHCQFDFIDEGRKRSEHYFYLRSLNLFTYLKKVFKADVVHINSGAFILRLMNVLVCRILLRKYTVVTIHRDPTIENHTGLTRFLLSCCNVVIAVNKNGYNLLKTDGKCEYHLLPAFLPPVMAKEPILDDVVRTWIDNVRMQSDSVLMVSNASALVFLNGQDVYGVDMCLEAMKRLKEEDHNYFLLFVIVQCDFPDTLSSYKAFIKENALEDNVLLLERPCSFVRLMQNSDIVLRTTNTDGDSISVREALSLGKPIISSDVVERPEGTILFKTRDVNDLVKVILETVDNKQTACVIDDNDYVDIYSRIYKL